MRQSHNSGSMKYTNASESYHYRFGIWSFPGAWSLDLGAFRPASPSFWGYAILALCCILLCGCHGTSMHHEGAPKKVLVVTVTKGFRHSSISTAEKVLAELGEKSGVFSVEYARVEPTDPQFKKSDG